MKVYCAHMYGRGVIIVTPGKEHPEHTQAPEWSERAFDLEGREYRKPRQLVVKFENGVADVPDALGEYLVKHGHAQTSMVTLPRNLAARFAEAEINRVQSENMFLTARLNAAQARIATLEAQLAMAEEAAA